MRAILLSVAVIGFLAIFASSQIHSAPALYTGDPHQSADIPAVRELYGQVDQHCMDLHNSYIKRGRQGAVDLLFIGDSITYRWQFNPSWNEFFGSYNVANFGINADRTQNVLWRIENGELDTISPKVIVLLIGTNNTGNSVSETVRGITKIVETIRQKLPHTAIVLMGLFPRGSDAKDRITLQNRAKMHAVNAEIARLGNGTTIRYLDIGDRFLDKDGNIAGDIMQDGLHPSDKGYRIWGAALQPLLKTMMAQQ